MSSLTFTSLETIAPVLQLVVGVLGLIFSIQGRAKGVSGLMVGAFVVMLITTAAGIAWQFVSLNVTSWSETYHLSVDQINLIYLGVGIPLDVVALLSWLLVALAVVRGRRPAQQFGVAPYSGPSNYSMTAQPGFVSPPPGYAQPGYQQPGYPQPGYAQPGYPQPESPQPGPAGPAMPTQQPPM
jgi:hypothetical protein